MRRSRLAMVGTLCSFFATLSACAHDDVQPATPQATYYPPPAASSSSGETTSPIAGSTGVESQQAPSTTGSPSTPPNAPVMGDPSGAANGTTGSATPPASSPLSDDDIAAIVETINRTELDAANIANARAQSSDVKDFAKTMIRDHSTALHQEAALVTAEHLTPNTSCATCQTLSTGAQEEATVLQQPTGQAFDRAYIDAMVHGHQKALSLIEDTLLPQVKDAQLKSHLESLKGHVETHLHKAMALQQKLGGASTGSTMTPR